MAESQRRLNSRVLEPALNLWLRSQVESVDTFSITLFCIKESSEKILRQNLIFLDLLDTVQTLMKTGTTEMCQASSEAGDQAQGQE